MLDLREEYLKSCDTPSDINEHLELLFHLALDPEVYNITEFGIGYGRSTRAFLAALEEQEGRLRSYDLKVLEGVQELFDSATAQDIDAKIMLESTLEADVEPMNLLLVDSMHNYTQVATELLKHGNKCTKFICFHDIVSYGDHDEFGNGPGILKAIEEFMVVNPHWQIRERRYNNNGMLVLERKENI
jgi:hypothetical protein